ncbi:MAG: hypothetical protein P1U56_18810 [Saprospiraceae bacterium]|nr:hypothetical protein [Saprospiraceae bacterium]
MNDSLNTIIDLVDFKKHFDTINPIVKALGEMNTPAALLTGFFLLFVIWKVLPKLLGSLGLQDGKLTNAAIVITLVFAGLIVYLKVHTTHIVNVNRIAEIIARDMAFRTIQEYKVTELLNNLDLTEEVLLCVCKLRSDLFHKTKYEGVDLVILSDTIDMEKVKEVKKVVAADFLIKYPNTSFKEFKQISFDRQFGVIDDQFITDVIQQNKELAVAQENGEMYIRRAIPNENIIGRPEFNADSPIRNIDR